MAQAATLTTQTPRCNFGGGCAAKASLIVYRNWKQGVEPMVPLLSCAACAEKIGSKGVLLPGMYRIAPMTIAIVKKETETGYRRWIAAVNAQAAAPSASDRALMRKRRDEYHALLTAYNLLRGAEQA